MQILYESDEHQVVAAISARLHSELQAGKHVTWFISGGSNIALEVRIMDQIPAELTPQLTVLLTDERFGTPGHADSNWTQLDTAGFQPGQARVLRTLQTGLGLTATCEQYDQTVRTALDSADAVIVQFGIGNDGHISGILPGSEPSRIAVDDPDAPFVAGYVAHDYSRITTTPPVWKYIDSAYVWAAGQGKLDPIRRLRDQDLTVEEQPSQLLKHIPEAYLYTDQKL